MHASEPKFRGEGSVEPSDPPPPFIRPLQLSRCEIRREQPDGSRRSEACHQLTLLGRQLVHRREDLSVPMGPFPRRPTNKRGGDRRLRGQDRELWRSSGLPLDCRGRDGPSPPAVRLHERQVERIVPGDAIAPAAEEGLEDRGGVVGKDIDEGPIGEELRDGGVGEERREGVDRVCPDQGRER